MCMAIQEGRACRFGQAHAYALDGGAGTWKSLAPADPNARRGDGSSSGGRTRANKLCHFFMERGGDCPYGARCNFARRGPIGARGSSAGTAAPGPGSPSRAAAAE